LVANRPRRLACGSSRWRGVTSHYAAAACAMSQSRRVSHAVAKDPYVRRASRLSARRQQLRGQHAHDQESMRTTHARDPAASASPHLRAGSNSTTQKAFSMKLISRLPGDPWRAASG
jgi:hypothetical protein